MMDSRQPQLGYSKLQALMLDETSRRTKAAKMASVIQHFLGRSSLQGLRIVDAGCSGGIIVDELHSRGATVIGLDIDRPGVRNARHRFAASAEFLCADSEAMPLIDSLADVVICNHVYEHVVSPIRLFAELKRVVKPSGMLYLGLGNRLGIVEPHYRLPFLSWLPKPLAHRYVRAFGRTDHYHEELTTWRGLKRLCHGLHVWDYTYAVLSDPDTFSAGDVVPGWMTMIPPAVLRAARPLVPTYIWVATREPAEPKGRATRIPPAPVTTPPSPTGG